MFGMVNYKPDRPESEDEHSTDKHIQWLQQSFKSRKSSDEHKVDTLMGLTLYKRRDDILSGDSIKDVVQKYPWLTTGSDSVLKEFRRISDIDINGNFVNFLNLYGETILKVLGTNSKNIVLKNLLGTTASADEKYAAGCAVVLALCELLKEDPAYLLGIVLPEPKEHPVFILYTDADQFLDVTSFKVFVDGVSICECGDFVEAFLTYLSTFSVFNLEYTKNLTRVLLFCERVIIQITGDKHRTLSKDEKRVISLLSCLNDAKGGSKSVKPQKRPKVLHKKSSVH